MKRIAAVLIATLALYSGSAAQEFDPRLRWEVGAAFGAEWEAWIVIKDAVVVDSTLFVLDQRLPALRRFDLQGRFLGNLGGRGEGPGEFSMPSALEPSRRGFILIDQTQRRVTEFDRDGEYLRQIPLPDGSAAPTRIWNVKNDWHIGYYVQPRRGDSTIVRVWKGGADPSTLIALENAFVQIRFRQNSNTFLPSIGIVEGVNGGISVFGDSAVAVVGKESVLRVLRPEGDQWVEVLRDTLPVSPDRVESSDHESVLSIVANHYSNDPRLVDPEFPDYWPTWTTVQGSSTGIWLKQGGKTGSVLGQYEERWWLWQPHVGAKLGVVLPSGTRALRFIGSKYVIGKRRTDFDVDVLQLFELVSRAKAPL